MALILNIDTAVDKASLCIAENETVIGYLENDIANTHATWINDAVKGLCIQANIKINDLNAIAVSNGPGSYTGLRIGLATAKGLCFALNKQLICLNTLEVMAHAAKNDAIDLICSAIDARRMEIFTAVLKKDLTYIVAPEAMVINENSFREILDQHHVLFTGNATSKLKSVINHSNAAFSNVSANASDMVALSLSRFHQQKFDDLSYAEPFYLKQVYFNKR